MDIRTLHDIHDIVENDILSANQIWTLKISHLSMNCPINIIYRGCSSQPRLTTPESNYHIIKIYFRTHDNHHIVTGWWFEPLWKILVNWDDYSQYMGNVPNHQPGYYDNNRWYPEQSMITMLGFTHDTLYPCMIIIHSSNHHITPNNHRQVTIVIVGSHRNHALYHLWSSYTIDNHLLLSYINHLQSLTIIVHDSHNK